MPNFLVEFDRVPNDSELSTIAKAVGANVYVLTENRAQVVFGELFTPTDEEQMKVKFNTVLRQIPSLATIALSQTRIATQQ